MKAVLIGFGLIVVLAIVYVGIKHIGAFLMKKSKTPPTIEARYERVDDKNN